MTLKQTLWSDAKRGAALAVFGVGAVASTEYVLGILTAQGSVRVVTALRFLALDLSLMGLVLLVAAPLLAAALVLGRLVYVAMSPTAGREWGGVGTRPTVEGIHPATPWIWALFCTALVYLGGSIFATLYHLKRFKAPLAIAASLGIVQLALIALLVPAALLLLNAFRAAARGCEPGLGRWNPFGRIRIALAGIVVLLLPPILVLKRMPVLRDALPWRMILATGVFATAVIAFAPLVARRGLWPRRREARRIAIPAAVVGWALLCAATLFSIGANEEVKVLTTTPRTPVFHLVRFVRAANDFDGDGYGSLLGENDCAPFNKRIHPNARDIPDNGIDENCNGRDFSAKAPASWRKGERAPVPAEFARKDWNFLLITIDTVRYDHTTMGGYKKTKGRDTTPRLAKLAERSVNFTFANAPSAGTMASMPAILTSRFFHSGIAMADHGPKPHYPPIILPENTLISEVMKRANYHTGAITSHEYFSFDWLAQGFDTYDNSLGDKPDPTGSKSTEVTDKAQAWIAHQGNNKWFLWAHYIDPHGRYVAHPGEVEYGTSEEDLYDGEISYTDKHIGRLLDYLAHSPAADRTIVIITSDHGDGFNEHGFINHGMALYRELLNVPLIVYVPENDPRSVAGPVSPLDILPTMADLAGVDVSDLTIEGESLVPQLFYGRDARERVVFSETNYPDPLRAAITEDYKLIYNLKANIYQLYDLKKDAWEKTNVWGKDKKGSDTMKEILDEWLDRVYFSRDPANQAQQQRAAILLPGPPTPEHVVDATIGGSLQVVGWDSSTPAAIPGTELKLTVYLETAQVPASSYKLEGEIDPTMGAATEAPKPAAPTVPAKGAPAVPAKGAPAVPAKDAPARPAVGPPVKPGAAPGKPPPGAPIKPPIKPPTPPPLRPVRQAKFPGDGTFPTNRWKAGDYIKETFTLRVPREWTGKQARLAFRLYDEKRQPVAATGAAVAADGTTVVLGDIPIDLTAIPPLPTPVPAPVPPGKPTAPQPERPAAPQPERPAAPLPQRPVAPVRSPAVPTPTGTD